MSARRPNAAQQGVTLVELMIVVMIIAVFAMAFGTGVRRTVLEQRMAAASREFVSLARNAKLSAEVLRVAHVLRVDPASASVRVLHGDTNSCLIPSSRGLTWEELNTACGKLSEARRAMGTDCVSVSFQDEPWSYEESSTLRIRERIPTGPTTDDDSAEVRTICFSPNGSVFHARGSATLVADNKASESVSLGGAFVFEITMTRGGALREELVPRRLLVPLTGVAKVLR